MFLNNAECIIQYISLADLSTLPMSKPGGSKKILKKPGDLVKKLEISMDGKLG